MTFTESTFTDKQPYKYTNKELDMENGLNLYDYEARQLDLDVPRFTTIDPLAEKYYSINPYVYVGNNPVNRIDPNRRQVVGLTKDDAFKVQQDLNSMFAGERFDKFNKKGTTFNSISTEAIKGAFEGITLNAVEQALVNEVAGVISSESVRKVEFVSIDGFVSNKGTSAFKTHLNNTQREGKNSKSSCFSVNQITINMRYIIIVLSLLLSRFCDSQNLQYADSVSRAKADIVLSYFDNIEVSKLLYSIGDKYFYVLLNENCYLKEYVITMDSLGCISNIKKPIKLTQGDKKLLRKLSPFELSKYGTCYITESSNAVDFTFGRLAYFVVKDNKGKRFGEFRSFMPNKTAPIDLKLWAYIIRKLSEQ